MGLRYKLTSRVPVTKTEAFEKLRGWRDRDDLTVKVAERAFRDVTGEEALDGLGDYCDRAERLLEGRDMGIDGEIRRYEPRFGDGPERTELQLDSYVASARVGDRVSKVYTPQSRRFEVQFDTPRSGRRS